MVLIEAMARGVPSIVADNFAATEVVGDAGLIIEKDHNVNEWFDENGGKRFGKGRFHDQFRDGIYQPHFYQVTDLAYAMSLYMDNRGLLKKRSEAALNEVKSGRFSINTRNKLLKEIYE